MALVQDKGVETAFLLQRLSPLFYPDLWLFIPLYSALGFFILEDYDVHWSETAMFSTVLLVHAFLLLMGYWRVKVRASLRYSRLQQLPLSLRNWEGKGMYRETFIAVFPVLHGGKPEICKLQVKRGSGGSTTPSKSEVSFKFQKQTYLYSHEKGVFQSVDEFLPPQSNVLFLMETTGIATDQGVSVLADRFGWNEFDIPIPKISDLFIEHALAPMFLFQVFCVGLWLLDENWYYALFTLAMLVLFEIVLCKQRQVNMQNLSRMRKPPYSMLVFRNSQWCEVLSNKLVPGDLVSVVTQAESASFQRSGGTIAAADSAQSSKILPCDLLLLEGKCVVNEAMLTGESIPTQKESFRERIRAGGSSESSTIDFSSQACSDSETGDSYAGSVLLGGTVALKHDVSDVIRQKGSMRPPDGGCLALVLRTGFSTTQGKLIRTILYSSQSVSVNDDVEAYLFIAILLVFAIVASGYVLYYSIYEFDPETAELKDKWEEKTDDERYSVFLHCIIIISSVVPPELPIELSLAVTTTLNRLQRINIFCTEPFRIPFAGKIDVCCFDKTGTLTSEKATLCGIALLPERTQLDKEMENAYLLTKVSDCWETVAIGLSCCHSLLKLGKRVQGEQMEKEMVRSTKYAMDADSNMVRKLSDGKREHIVFLKRYSFQSKLKRMSVLVETFKRSKTARKEGAKTYVFCKGAPETLLPLFSSSDAEFRRLYLAHAQHFMSSGKRVLALGFKELTATGGGLAYTRQTEIQQLTRSDAESCLTFLGFLVFQSPLKKDTAESITCLSNADHHCVMITGDNHLTAIDVAKRVSILQSHPNKLFMLSLEKEQLCLKPVLVEEQNDAREALSHRLDLSERSLLQDKLQEVTAVFEIVVTGDTLQALQDQLADKEVFAELLKILAPHVRVFARMTPNLKELVIVALKTKGLKVLMCGDGTNDVGALKQAHVGISILSNSVVEDRVGTALDNEAARSTTHLSLAEKLQLEAEALEKANRQLGLTDLLLLGDASIASPFTSRNVTINSVVSIVINGRCTLITTLQIYKILGLNCLISAFSLSVLYLNDVKQGDTQSTLLGMCLAMMFFFLSSTEPSSDLVGQKPKLRIFSTAFMLSLFGQFAVHLLTLMFICSLALDQQYSALNERPSSLNDSLPIDDPINETLVNETTTDLSFFPNLINTCVYLIGIVMQVNVFAVNYRGKPYMVELTKNKKLFRTLVGMYLFALVVIFDEVLDLGELVELVKLPNFQFKLSFLAAVIMNSVATYVWEAFVRKMIES